MKEFNHSSYQSDPFMNTDSALAIDMRQAVTEIMDASFLSKNIIVGFSGGLDSTVLLHLVSTVLHNSASNLKAARNVYGVHINHGLSPLANDWAMHCVEFGTRHNIQIDCICVDVIEAGKGLEQAARKERYDAFARVLQLNDLLLTAHHLDDQVETFFLRLLRGSGLKGLQSIAAQRAFAKGTLARPLLKFTRADLLRYAHENNLSWIDDESNNDAKFDRNFLRHNIIPALKQRWPRSNLTIERAVNNLQISASVLDEFLDEALQTCDAKTDRFGHSINLNSIQALGNKRGLHCIRYWLEQTVDLFLSEAHTRELGKLINAYDDANPQVNVGKIQLRRFKQRLYCVQLNPSSDSAELASFQVSWHANKPLILPDGSTLTFKPKMAVNNGLFTVRYRKGGERCQPESRGRSQTLKKLFQEQGVPPWLRDNAPLIYLADELIAVADFWLCRLNDGNTIAGRFNWHREEQATFK